MPHLTITSFILSPNRERRISERDSPSERKDDEDEGRVNDAAMLDAEKGHGQLHHITIN